MISRVGFGYDAHCLVSGKRLLLGGVEIKSAVGVKAHSDGDVLLHAIIDALLGALAKGDIGKHFPDSESQYKNIDSRILLKKACDIVLSEGYKVMNVDSTICLQAPELSPYIDDMRKSVAGVLDIPPENVSVKATTTERMGFVGTGEGIAAYAVVLLIKDNAEAKLI